MCFFTIALADKHREGLSINMRYFTQVSQADKLVRLVVKIHRTREVGAKGDRVGKVTAVSTAAGAPGIRFFFGDSGICREQFLDKRRLRLYIERL